MVDALVAADSLPSDKNGYRVKLKFVFDSGLLTINEINEPQGIVQTLEYFKCGEVLDGLHSESGNSRFVQ